MYRVGTLFTSSGLIDGKMVHCDLALEGQDVPVKSNCLCVSDSEHLCSNWDGDGGVICLVGGRQRRNRVFVSAARNRKGKR